MHFGVVDFVDEAVLLRDAAAPLVAAVAAQLLGLAGALFTCQPPTIHLQFTYHPPTIHLPHLELP